MRDLRRRRAAEDDPVRAAERWFLTHGLSYFVPGERQAAREALRPRHFLLPLGGVVLLAAGLAVVVAWPLGRPTAIPAVLLTCGLGGALLYALFALRARPIVTWALSHTAGRLRTLLSMASRALPLLLVFVTFLFINAEAWQMSASLAPGVLWLTVLFLLMIAVVFLLVRLPEEVDRVDDAVDDAFLRRACRGTPLEQACTRLLAEGAAPARRATVTGFARWNLILVLLVLQVAQVLLLVLAVFGFFLVFGSLIMSEAVQESWTGVPSRSVPLLDTVTVELMQVSLFLAAFSGLYFTVSAVTDETYRSQFFASVTAELERAVGTRAVYLTLLETSTPAADAGHAGDASGSG